MLVPGALIPIAGSGAYPIPYPPGPATHIWTQLKLENASAYGFTLYMDGTPVHSIPAGVADVFPLTTGPALPAPGSPLSAPAAQLLAVTTGEPPFGDTPGDLRPSFAQYGDNFPGFYPLALPGQSGSLSTSNTAYLSYVTGCANNATAQLIPPPAAGNYWEVASMGLWAKLPSTTGGYISIEGLNTSNTFLILVLDAASPTKGQIFSASKYTLNEGLRMSNLGTGITAAGCGSLVVARQVPTSFAPT